MADDLSEIAVTEVPRLQPRATDGNKGMYGKVLVVAGSVGMSGAAVLVGSAALRAGAGLVQVAVPEPILDVVASGQPCYMTAPLPSDGRGHVGRAAATEVCRLAAEADVVVIGPGLGAGDDIADLLRALIAARRCPLVLDADALNAIARHPDLLAGHSGDVVVTPHPGEFGRLTGLETKVVQAQRRELAIAFARKHRLVVLLKGAGTIVTDGRRVYINTTGNPGMATGGAGDVLSGIIGALIGQQLGVFEAAVLGAHVHGLAGDLARDNIGEVSLIATDLIAHLPAAFEKLAES